MNIYLLILLICLFSLKAQDTINDIKYSLDSVCDDPEHKHYSGTTLGYITPWYIIIYLT
jgi:hypothetical protein